jgi:hypothetical protein
VHSSPHSILSSFSWINSVNNATTHFIILWYCCKLLFMEIQYRTWTLITLKANLHFWKQGVDCRFSGWVTVTWVLCSNVNVMYATVKNYCHAAKEVFWAMLLLYFKWNRVHFNNWDQLPLTCLLSSDELAQAPYLREPPVEQDTVISCLIGWQQYWATVLMYLAPAAAALQINTDFFIIKHLK